MSCFCCRLNILFAVKWQCSLVLLMHMINYTDISSITQTRPLKRISLSGRLISYAVRQEIAKLAKETKSETRDTVFLWFKDFQCRTFHGILFEKWDYLELVVWIKLHCTSSSLRFISARSKYVSREVSES